MTRPHPRPINYVASLLAIVCLLSSWLVLWPRHAGAVVDAPARVAAVRSGHHTSRPARACRPNPRSVGALPAPLVSFDAPYVPGACDPMHTLPKQAFRMFACVRWREGGDTPNEPNGAGMYQFTNRATWNEFRGRFPEVPSRATALEQDIVAYRAWKTEQFLPWNGDPCLGSVREYGKWGWY